MYSYFKIVFRLTPWRWYVFKNIKIIQNQNSSTPKYILGSLFKKIWSAAALADSKYHDLIIKAHMDYIESGSTIITTNSYATQPNYYVEAYGKDYEQKMLEHAKVS